HGSMTSPIHASMNSCPGIGKPTSRSTIPSPPEYACVSRRMLTFRRGLHYVGDWHTHPQAVPEASGTDIASMSSMVAASHHELSGFLMIIIGTLPLPQGLWISLHRPDGEWERLRIVAI
ncbi:Mov34/MPN/PAD-1 family protein, partial [Komagataeibacter oboediens]|nr:Mov34/MPN/PAD-1 family protein [Komagataeibacter oboediens]